MELTNVNFLGKYKLDPYLFGIKGFVVVVVVNIIGK
jgi:hypothetical protein